MTIAHRQTAKIAATSSTPTTLPLSSAPLNGSALIAAVGCASDNGVASITQTGANWNLLLETSNQNAEEVNGVLILVQIWGAFNVQSAGIQIEFSFSGGVTDRGIIVAEYTGDVFRFPNPADRVVGNVGTTGAGLSGTASTGVGGTTRENDELWVAATGANQNVTWSNPIGGFTIRDTKSIGTGPLGNLALLDRFTTATGALQSGAKHSSDPSATAWAAVAAAMRGILQVPFVGPDAPTAAEPVSEISDYSSAAIEKLAAQFRSKV
jgi:hypothetical protein